MENKKYKIVLLSDLTDSIYNTLRSTSNLAKMINGEIEVFNVRKPSDVVKKENQLSAMRTINSEHSVTDKKLKDIIQPLAEELGLNINYSFVFGNVKNEIDSFLKLKQPDIVVIGKKKLHSIHFLGDNITDFVLKKHSGVVMIAPDRETLALNTNFSMGTINGWKSTSDFEILDHLLKNTQKPLKSFRINRKGDVQASSDISGRKMVEYVFEHNDNSIQSLPKYLTRSKIDMLLVNRQQNKLNSKSQSISSDLKKVMSKIDVTLLVGATGLA
ncbi:universal stress protein [Pseudozobellia sp. WGM2]|uniref:universal stress protein n=1 Tax=Pseudozobellia sp. WGM2 TaxID=2787625 RepID=UPI001ADFCB07|nr:universal stress protein [Pseudozobellia sp. WGM2]